MNNTLRQLRHRPGQYVATLLITTIATMFGTGLIAGRRLLNNVMDASGFTESGTIAFILALIGIVFFFIAVFVASIVVVNSFSIVVAGRTGEIALLRLIGATASRLRRHISREGLAVGVVGALLGTVLAESGIHLAAAWATSRGQGSNLSAGLWSVPAMIPGLLVVLMSWGSAWIGSRPVTTVSPLEATRRSAEPALKTLRSNTGLKVISAILVSLGALLLVGGTLLGALSPGAVLLSMLGGILSFTGIALGAAWIMPAFLGLAGRFFGGAVASRMAVGNTKRYPLRSARTSMGLVIGMTLVVMFATAGESFKDQARGLLVNSGASEAEIGLFNEGIDNSLLFLYAMLAFSVVIAAVGVANNMMASVMQRHRELGMLRTVGLSQAQLWRMIGVECAQLTLGAAIFAIPLGILYGWLGTLGMLWSVEGIGLFGPSMPWPALAALIVGCLIVTTVATALPVRKTTQEPPVAALAVS